MGTPATLAGVSDLGDWLSEPIADGSDDAKRAALCLRMASALVRKETGRTFLRDDGELVDPMPDDVVLVTLYCAGRVYENREAQTTGGVDDYREGWKVDESGAYLTASEKRMLAGYRTTGVGGLGTITTTRLPPHRFPPGWVPTPTEEVLFPWY
ncbi:head-tail connector protein [Curtobacterium sp. MCBD17_003]|uniref:head-tail connector protein n=1 Tax=Curtobacterium sp. MCBD17_003 TaxID=2175667 RepID=UPI000DA91936|nr:head-tail connector protein [Curtobacterium sp. MCBD17_003]WIE54225.1 head-tail connector protein [Curtobacterium sp. MCBD17_003]